jgi:hypothetical protein
MKKRFVGCWSGRLEEKFRVKKVYFSKKSVSGKMKGMRSDE